MPLLPEHGSARTDGIAVLVVDNLPLMRRFDDAPLIQPIGFKTAIC